MGQGSVRLSRRCKSGSSGWLLTRPGSSKNDGAVRALAMEVGCAVCGVALLGMAAGSALGLVYEKVSGGRSGASAKRA